MVREKKERAAEAENNDWEEGSVEDGRWKREEVAGQRLFFNVWYYGTGEPRSSQGGAPQRWRGRRWNGQQWGRAP